MKKFVKSQKLAKKAMSLFDNAIKSLEDANRVLETGKEEHRTEYMVAQQEIAKLEEKQCSIISAVEQHDKEIIKNAKAIEKLREFFN